MRCVLTLQYFAHIDLMAMQVRIPIVSKCRCGCGPLFVGDGIQYTGRIGGPVSVAIPGVNT